MRFIYANKLGTIHLEGALKRYNNRPPTWSPNSEDAEKELVMLNQVLPRRLNTGTKCLVQLLLLVLCIVFMVEIMCVSK